MDEVAVLDAFRDAYGRMFTRGGETWLDTIPKDAFLTMEDVKRVKAGETALRVLMPQTYREIEELANEHELFTLKPNSAFGCFYAMLPSGAYAMNYTSNAATDKLMIAVTGTSGDFYYKITPSLVEHAENWE